MKAGGALYGKLPEHSPSLQNAKEADQTVKRLTDEIKKGGYKYFESGDLQKIMNGLNIGPAVSGYNAGEILWTHRQTAEMDIFFISNQKKETVNLKPVFRVAEDRAPEFWYADTGKIERMGAYSPNAKGTEVPLTLDPHGSVFVIFRKSSLASNIPIKTHSVSVNSKQSLTENAWTLSFMPGRDVPDKIKLEKLGMWTESKDKAIEHYSGTARYSTVFNIAADWKKSDKEKAILDLGKVNPMARVYLNGKDLGLLWKPPYQVDVTASLRPGMNELEIDITNLWINRMVGELKYPNGFPGKEGKKQFHPKSSIQSRGINQRKVIPSGLSGPVKLELQLHEPITQPKK